MLCVNLTSCNNDENENLKDEPKNEITNTMTTEEKLLVGEWISDGGNPLELYSDKSCYTPDRESGTYSYDSQTKELITTSGWGIRIVKSLDDKTMVLQGVQTSKVWTYDRQMNFIDKQYDKLIIGTWQNTESPNQKIVFSDSNTYNLGMGDIYYEIITGGKYSDGSKYILVSAQEASNNYNLYIKHLDCNVMIVYGSGKPYDGTYKRVQ